MKRCRILVVALAWLKRRRGPVLVDTGIRVGSQHRWPSGGDGSNKYVTEPGTTVKIYHVLLQMGGYIEFLITNPQYDYF